jgi:WD40 repeat protein
VYLCRFSPCIYRMSPNSDKVSTVCAIAGMDEAITVWVAGMTTPLVVLRNLFGTGSLVTDLAWSRDGKTLMASGMGGATAVVQFEDMHVGAPLTPAQTAVFLQKHFGDISQER